MPRNTSMLQPAEPVSRESEGTEISWLFSNKLLNVLAALVLSLTCVPVVRAVFLLYSVGANCASNDCVRWIGTIDSILSGTFNWLELPSACYAYPHFVLIPYLIQLAQIFGGVWDVRTETCIGLILLAVSSYLQWDMLRESLSKRLQLALLAGVVAVNFSATQYSTLLCGIFSVMISGSCLFGFTLSVWGLSKYRKVSKYSNLKVSNTPLVLMGVGLVVSAYSWGTVLPASFCTLVALLALGYRSRRSMTAWCTASMIAFVPYVFFSSEVLKNSSLPLGTGLLNLDRILDVVGRSLSNNIAVQLDRLPQSIEVGTAGCIAFFCMVSYLVAHKSRLPGLVPLLALSLYSFISAVLIASSRVHIAPWYAVPTKFIWVAVVTLSIYCISQIDRRSLSERSLSERWLAKRILPAALGVIVLSLFTWRYVWVNESYDDKHFYLKSRTPASESYQRHYLTAPTYGEPLIFQWQSGGVNQTYAHSLGSALERHGLLGFSKHQQWTLQGDYFLNNVQFGQKPSISIPIWTDGAWPIHPMPWHDYHHLDMAIKAPQVVTWRLTIPAGCRAMLRTACCPAAVKSSDSFNGTNASITIRPVSTPSSVILPGDQPSLASESVLQRTLHRNSTWKKMEQRLDQFAGQDVEIQVSSTPGQAVLEGATSSFPNQEPDWIAFQFPRIDLVLKDGTYGTASATNSKSPVGMKSRPCNTDLSSDFPGYKDSGTILNAVPGVKNAFNGGNFVARNFSHLQLSANTHGGVGAGALIVTFKYANYPDFAAVLPLLPDAKPHDYTYDLKLLQAPADAKLKSVEFQSQKPDQTIQVSDVKLLQAFLN